MQTRYAVTAVVVLALLGGCSSSDDDAEEQSVENAFEDSTDPNTPSTPGTQPSEPSGQPSEPSEQPSEPDEQPSEPGEQPSEPGEQPTEPGEQPSEPGEQPSEPGEQPTEPDEQPSEPGDEPSAQPSEQPSEPGDSDPTDGSSVPDPMTRNETRVDFEITVPAYVSDELQVRVFWGDKNLEATWNGDESWSATDDFPADEERPLMVVFYDRNGDITLGSVQRDFRTGTNVAETFTVVAEDFDTGRWDDDSDGVSNLEELRGGTDPAMADAPGAPRVLDEFREFGLTLEFFAATLEGAFASLDLPAAFSEQIVDDRLPTSKRVTDVTYDFSAEGNGTYESSSEFEIALDEGSTSEVDAARSRQGESVTWSGTSLFREGSDVIERTFEFTGTVDGRELVRTGTSRTSSGFGGEEAREVADLEYDVVLDLDSVDADGNCAILRGSIVRIDTRRDGSSSSTTASRDTSDDRWSVTGDEFADLRYPDPTEAISLLTRGYCAFDVEG